MSTGRTLSCMTQTASQELLTRSMTDESFLDQFRADPEGALEEYDLSSEEEEALVSGKDSKVREIVDDGLAAAVIAIVVTT